MNACVVLRVSLVLWLLYGDTVAYWLFVWLCICCCLDVFVDLYYVEVGFDELLNCSMLVVFALILVIIIGVYLLC